MMGNQMLGVVLYYCVFSFMFCMMWFAMMVDFIMQIEEHRTMTKTKAYIAIDLKSFYASVECKERNRDPLTTNLVVADQSRTEKTICLAVSPSLKSYGIPGRPRLFEVVQKIKEVNNTRRWKALNRTFTGSSDDQHRIKVQIRH